MLTQLVGKRQYRNLPVNVPSGSIPNHANLEAAKMSVRRGIVGHTVAHPYREYDSAIKQGEPSSCEEVWMHLECTLKWKKPVWKGYPLHYYFNPMTFRERE